MKSPSPRSLLLIPLCFYGTSLTALPASDSTIIAMTTETHAGVAGRLRYRTFDDLLTSKDLHSNMDPIEVPKQHLPDSVVDKRAHAHALREKVLREQRFLETLDAFSEIELPVGIVKAGGALDYSIIIDHIQFTRDGALMDAYASLTLPQTGAQIAFHGVIPLSADGGISGVARIFLLGNHPIKLSSTALVTLKGTDRSYIEFDCSGFLGVNLDAELEFSTDLLVPENENGEPNDERLKIDFTTYAQTLHDIRAQISIPPFQVKGLKGFGFHVTKASLDWSDLSNPREMVFPKDYTSPLIDAGLDELWQGVYLQELEVKLPPAFVKRNATDRVAVGVRQMIIDDQGLTGEMYVQNVIPDGDMNGWVYSLDKLAVELTSNEVTGFGLEGRLSIPMVKGSDGGPTQFRYTAQRAVSEEYIFSVQIEDELKLDLWMANMKLLPGSSVIVASKGNKFFPSAHLSGELTISLSGDGPKASLNSVRFENMVINSEAPYFEPGTFGFGREGQSSSISKYPVVFDNINIKSEDRRVGIAFDITINITGKPEDESFSGKGGLVVWGTQDEAPAVNADGKVTGAGRHNWRFDKLELTGVKINIKKPKVIELAGELRFFNDDETYGDGFKGTVKGTISSIHVEAQALFGRTETFRYWYADALAELKTGVPIVPGVLSAFGFGGGYYSRMKQGVSSGSVTLGKSPSGLTYVPDEHTVGIRAIVLIGTPRPEAMSGDVSLEVILNRHGGINSVTFTGNANFMSAASLGKAQIKQLAASAVDGNLTEKLVSLIHGQVFGSVRLHFDNVNDIFHGNLEIYVNVAGGIVRGVSARNKAGWAVLHFEKNDWYIHIGTPDQPLGLEVARIFKAKSYFMLGKNLPGSPPPPPQVSEILGNIDLDYMRDMNALESGMGIAFGLHFIVDTGDLRFLMFYGRFSAGTGLDFMLKDYGNEYHCAGSSGPMGINGWYANGQAYAFVMGKIGIKVDLRFYKGTYDILSIGAAAILQAKGPNPFWMKGTVGGYYKILGGLVKGKCRFEVTIGKECKPVGSENLLDDVKFIAQISPTANTRDVDVFNTPQVAFTIPIGEVFEITDMENNKHSFRAVLDEFTVSENNRPLNGELSWNRSRDVVVFDAADILPSRKKIKASARLTFEEKRNGLWTKVKFNGQIVTETAETSFETGTAPDYIPEKNILVSYPQIDQINFYPDEYPEGFIQLKDGQPYLFKAEKGWTQKIRFHEWLTGVFLETDFTYNPGEKRILFALPEGFKQSEHYRLEVVSIPNYRNELDANVRRIETEINVDPSAGSATITTPTIEGYAKSSEDKTLYQHAFRTSMYNTFIQKMEATRVSTAVRLNAGINIFQLAANLEGDERIDVTETTSSPGSEAFVTLEAIPKGNRWYEQHVYPLVYEGYPLLGWMKVKRPNPYELGIPPVRAVSLRNGEERDATVDYDGEARPLPYTNSFVSYNLGEFVAADYRDLQQHAVNYITDHPRAQATRLESLIIKPQPYIRYGPYKIRLTYRIPGLNKATSSYELEIFNPIRDND